MTLRYCQTCKGYREENHRHPPSLFDPVEPELEMRPWPELARSNDPDTSQEAAVAAAQSKPLKAIMLRLLVHFAGGLEWTSEEVSLRAGLDPERCSKRTSDLIRLGFLEATGETRRGTTGRRQRVLKATERGVETISQARWEDVHVR